MISSERAIEIISNISDDGDFPCHKTVDYSRRFEGEILATSRRCFGAALFLENTDLEARGNLAFRIALMSGEFGVSDLRKDSSVFESIAEMTH